MKNSIVIFLITTLLIVSVEVLYAQKDTIKTEYSTKIITDTCNTFSCKYNYLIRAKVEETDLFKLGEGGVYDNPGWIPLPIQISLAYEHKISPAFSILADTRYWVPGFHDYILTEGIRYYYNMPRRIRLGKAANNFSGNYFSLQQENNFVNPIGKTFLYAPTVDLLYGFQRRLGPYDYLDAGIGISWRNNYWQYDYSSTTAGGYRLIITANFAVGLAVVNFKRQLKNKNHETR